MFRTTTLAAAIVSLSLLNGLRAETKPDATGGNPPAAKTEVKAVSGVLDDAKLKEMLDMLGHDMREVKLNDAGVGYYIKIRKGSYTFDMRVCLSGDKRKLWATTALAEFKPEHAARADKLMRLLELNKTVGPCFFDCAAKTKMLYIEAPLDNRGLTAKIVREHIEQVADTAFEFEADWNTSKWSAETKTTASKTEK